MVGDGSRQQSLAGPWRPVQENTLGLCNAQALKQLRMLDGQLDHFLDLLDLAVQTTDHLVRRVRYFLDHHQRDKRVDLVGQYLVQLVRVGAQRHAQARRQRSDVNVVGNLDYVFALWLHLDEHLFPPHDLDDLTNIAPWLLKKLELLAQKADTRVERVALCLEASQVLRALIDKQFLRDR